MADDSATVDGASASGSPEAERRVVTVLFADLVGFTTRAEGTDPESVRDLLTRYFDLASDRISRYGGTVEKFIGDAVMAVWGTPTAREDDAERAVRAALDLTQEVPRLSGGPALEVRAAVVTGDAAVTLNARGQGMVAGDVVNTASRLQSLAAPGSVLVGEATYRSAREAIVFEEAGEQQLRGRELPVRAWRAVRVVGGIRGSGRSSGVEPPFTGRDAELALLKDLFHATQRDRRLRVVSVTGVAGVGKSRLAWEFEKYLDGLVDTTYWHRGRSPAYGERIAFWALGEMVRQRARIAETDDDRATREKLLAALDDLIPDEGDRRWIEPRLTSLLGLEEAPPGEREELFAAWRRFFECVADRGPSVLLFEDLHWADPGLLDFIEAMVEWTRERPIFVVTLARPELRDRRPTWGAGLRNFTDLHLDPLPESAMHELLCGYAPDLAAEVLDEVVRRADGIPLYAVETVRTLIDEGRLVASEGGYRLKGPLDQLTVPPTLHALIAARLDALRPDDRRLLQDASVLGQTFTVAAIASVHGRTREELEPRLRDLVRREMLVLEADPRSPERGQYGFVQGLIREVAYGTLARPERRSRHMAAARYYEALGEDELAGVLANHYLEAFRAAEGPEAGAVRAQARIALHAAAQRARELHSHDQALSYLERELSVVEEDTDRAPLLLEAAMAAEAAARIETAERIVDEAIATYGRLDDPVGVARATAVLGRLRFNTGQVAQAIEKLQSAVDELRGGDQEAFAVLASTLARAYMLHDEGERAREWAERALEAAAPGELVAVIADALNTQGTTMLVGRLHQGRALVEGALAVARSYGLVAAELRARNNLGFLTGFDDPVRAHEIAREGLAMATRVGHRDYVQHLTINVALAGRYSGLLSWDEAIALLDAAEDQRTPPSYRAAYASGRALVAAYRGDRAEAERQAARMESLMQGTTGAQEVIYALVNGAELAWVFGDFRRGLELARRAFGTESMSLNVGVMAVACAARIPDLHGVDEGLAEARRDKSQGRTSRAARTRVEGVALAAHGDRQRAAMTLLESARIWRELRTPLPLAMVLLDFVEFIGPDHPETDVAAAEARPIFEQFGATTMLSRIDQALGRGADAHEVRRTERTSVPAGVEST